MTSIQIPSQDRIITVDVLRGFALFGILYSHMIFWYTAGPLPERLFNSNQDIASGIAMSFYGLFFIGKFFSFFSFLFGLSFYLQMKSFENRNENFLLRYGWRLLILGIIGLLHHALWRGDILSIYVPLGFILIAARNLSNKTIVFIGFILLLNIPTKMYEAGVILWRTTPIENTAPTFQKEGEEYFNIVKNASFTEMTISNWNALSVKFNYQITSGRLIITLGFFFIGMYAGRMDWFRNLETLKPFVENTWKKVSYSLLIVIGCGIIVGGGCLLAGVKIQESDWAKWFFGMLYDFFSAGLTIFYISGLTLLTYNFNWQKILYPLANIGKMALTSYLMQTIFGLLIFYSFGLGLFTVTSPAINALIAVGIFLFQVLISKWWLTYFSYGPIEWLWRALTFFELFPISIKRKRIPILDTVENKI